MKVWATTENCKIVCRRVVHTNSLIYKYYNVKTFTNMLDTGPLLIRLLCIGIHFLMASSIKEFYYFLVAMYICFAVLHLSLRINRKIVAILLTVNSILFSIQLMEFRSLIIWFLFVLLCFLGSILANVLYMYPNIVLITMYSLTGTIIMHMAVVLEFHYQTVVSGLISGSTILGIYIKILNPELIPDLPQRKPAPVVKIKESTLISPLQQMYLMKREDARVRYFSMAEDFQKRNLMQRLGPKLPIWKSDVLEKWYTYLRNKIDQEYVDAKKLFVKLMQRKVSEIKVDPPAFPPGYPKNYPLFYWLMPGKAKPEYLPPGYYHPKGPYMPMLVPDMGDYPSYEVKISAERRAELNKPIVPPSQEPHRSDGIPIPGYTETELVPVKTRTGTTVYMYRRKRHPSEYNPVFPDVPAKPITGSIGRMPMSIQHGYCTDEEKREYMKQEAEILKKRLAEEAAKETVPKPPVAPLVEPVQDVMDRILEHYYELRVIESRNTISPYDTFVKRWRKKFSEFCTEACYDVVWLARAAYKYYKLKNTEEFKAKTAAYRETQRIYKAARLRRYHAEPWPIRVCERMRFGLELAARDV